MTFFCLSDYFFLQRKYITIYGFYHYKTTIETSIPKKLQQIDHDLQQIGYNLQQIDPDLQQIDPDLQQIGYNLQQLKSRKML